MPLHKRWGGPSFRPEFVQVVSELQERQVRKSPPVLVQAATLRVSEEEGLMNAMGIMFPFGCETFRWHTAEKYAPEDEVRALQVLGMWCARYTYQCFHMSRPVYVW